MAGAACALHDYVHAVAVEELMWGLPLGDFPRIFSSTSSAAAAAPASAARGAADSDDADADAADITAVSAASRARPYDTILGADLLYNPALYPFLLPTVLRLLAIVPTEEEEEGGEEEVAAAAAAAEEPQLGSASAVVYMCYMERGGEEAFFAAASAKGVLCDRPKLSPQVRKRLSNLYQKRSFYQDRLGTNIGKTPKKDSGVFLQLAALGEELGCVVVRMRNNRKGGAREGCQ
eukprot:COSAG06_NODE_9367_length_1919_cov_74.963736_1_plen_234_part_00